MLIDPDKTIELAGLDFLGVCCHKGCCEPSFYQLGVCLKHIQLIRAHYDYLRGDTDFIAQMQSKTKYIYFVYAKENRAVKIGMSDHPRARLVDLQVSNPSDLEIVTCIRARPELEPALHDHFKSTHIRGEWFRVNEDLITLFDDLSEGKKHKLFDKYGVDLLKAFQDRDYFIWSNNSYTWSLEGGYAQFSG